MGQDVRLIAPNYVKPDVKRQKNDAADAEAICEAAQRPTMQFDAMQSEDKQSSAMIIKARDFLVRQRTQTINALRGHLVEFGIVAHNGTAHLDRLILHVEASDSDLPQPARAIVAFLPRSPRKSVRS